MKNILQEEEEAKVTCSKERKEEKEEEETICEGDTFFSSLSSYGEKSPDMQKLRVWIPIYIAPSRNC